MCPFRMSIRVHLLPLVVALGGCGGSGDPSGLERARSSDAVVLPDSGVTHAPSPDDTSEGGAEASTTDAGAARGDASDGGQGPSTYDAPAVCPTTFAVGAGTKLPTSPRGDAAALSVTPDELTIAWQTRESDAVTIHYVDRSAANLAFGPERTITGAFAPERIALRPDGLVLAVVDLDGLGFSMLSRSERGGAFGEAEVGDFAVLAEQGKLELAAAGERYADPLFARDGSYFFHSRIGGGRTTTVHVATRTMFGGPYSTGAPFVEHDLAAVSGKRRILTGASADVRALFVWDEAAAKSRVLSLDATGQPITSFEVGTMRELQPASPTCAGFYFARAGEIWRAF